jgi:Ca2+-binding RTX toxin-like protein
MASFTLDPDQNQFVNYASMIIPSNDAFIGNSQAAELFDSNGDFTGPIDSLILGSRVYDAGTEENTETEAAFLNQTGPDMGDDENGVVTLHPGFIGSAGNPGSGGNILGGTSAAGTFIDPTAADFTLPDFEVARIHINLVETQDGTAGDDVLIGGDADDLISGLRGDDFLIGEDGFDDLTGGFGDDTLVGGNGDDVLEGDGGAKFRFISEDAGFASAIGFADPTTGEATIVLADTSDTAADGFRMDIDPPEGAVWFLIPDAVRVNSNLEAGGGFQLTEVGGVYQILDADGNAILGRGEGFAIEPIAYFSDVSLNSDGAEHVRTVANGRMEWEDLHATNSDFDFNDVIVRVSEFSGSDTFVLGAGNGTDTILDFEVGTDFIGLAGELEFDDLSFDGDRINFGDETLAIVENVDSTTLGESDFTLF